MFRVTLDVQNNQDFRQLGDRVLAAWVGNTGSLHFPTYTYTSLNGEGNSNVVRNIEHKNRHTSWHFVYFGYSFKEKKARAVVLFSDNSQNELTYDSINHYLPGRLFVLVGRDMPTDSVYNGLIAYARITTGKNSFKKANDFDEESDSFGFKLGLPLKAIY